MTGVQQMLLGSDGGPVSLRIDAVADVEVTPTSALGSVALNTNGTVFYDGNGSGGSTTWHNPIQPGIGNSYWAKLVVNSGPLPVGSAVNAVVSINATLTWTWISGAGQIKTGDATLFLYKDAAGTQQVAVDNFPFNVRST